LAGLYGIANLILTATLKQKTMTNLQIQQLTVAELQALISKAVADAINERIPPAPIEARKLTKNQAAKVLNRSTVTLDNWVKRGVLQPIRQGGRIYFKESDVIKIRETGI
jgi:hypothetical protein